MKVHLQYNTIQKYYFKEQNAVSGSEDSKCKFCTCQRLNFIGIKGDNESSTKDAYIRRHRFGLNH